MNLTREMFGKNDAEISAIPQNAPGKSQAASFSAFLPDHSGMKRADESSNLIVDDIDESDR